MFTMMGRRTRVVAYCLLGLGGLLGVVAACFAVFNALTPSPPKPVTNWTIEDARQFDEFPLYWLGQSYRGLPLTVLRIAGPAYTHAHVNVRFIYGEQTLVGPRPSDSWQAPLEVSIYHVCDNPPEEWVPRLEEDGDVTRIQVLGVDAYVQRAQYDYDYVYAWSGRSAIFIDGWNLEFDIEEAARDLIGISAAAGPGSRTLPPPVPIPC